MLCGVNAKQTKLGDLSAGGMSVWLHHDLSPPVSLSMSEPLNYRGVVFATEKRCGETKSQQQLKGKD